MLDGDLPVVTAIAMIAQDYGLEMCESRGESIALVLHSDPFRNICQTRYEHHLRSQTALRSLPHMKGNEDLFKVRHSCHDPSILDRGCLSTVLFESANSEESPPWLFRHGQKSRKIKIATLGESEAQVRTSNIARSPHTTMRKVEPIPRPNA